MSKNSEAGGGGGLSSLNLSLDGRSLIKTPGSSVSTAAEATRKQAPLSSDRRSSYLDSTKNAAAANKIVCAVLLLPLRKKFN